MKSIQDYENELILLRHQIDSLVGKNARLVDDCVDLLSVAIKSLNNKTPRIEVAMERIEVVVSKLSQSKLDT